MRTRAERYRLMLAHKAAASALEASLKDAAAEEFNAEGVRVSWEMPGGGLVYASLHKDAATVTDAAALLAWVKANRPDQIQVIESVRPAYLEALLQQVVPVEMGEEEPQPEDAKPGASFAVVLDGDGNVIPGVRWVKGGGLSSVSIRNDPSAVRRMNLAAAAYADGTGAMPGLESGESNVG